MIVKDIQDFKDQDLAFEFLSGILQTDCRPQKSGLRRQKNRLQHSEVSSDFDRTQRSVSPSGSSHSHFELLLCSHIELEGVLLTSGLQPLERL